ncbi:LOW QUALITY PROTEIN: PIH1 domain-containing protein Nop17-like [Aphomia sociella]
MATGVKPRDEEPQLTRSDLEAIQDAMKCKKFRDLLTEYCEEVRDPANQALYQKEMIQLEKERGYDVTFINPRGYVIKTSVAGDRKAFINICSNENVDKPSCNVQEINGQKGMNWLLPYSLIPPREDYNNKKERCVIYDVVFHPDTLRMAEVNKRFRELVNKTAFDGLQKTYNIHFDSNNFRFPKSNYKGMMIPAVIRKEDPNYVPPTDEETEDLSSEVLDKLYPQHNYNEKMDEPPEGPSSSQKQKKQAKKCHEEFAHHSENGYTIPKYVIKQQKNVDLQEFTYHKDSKQYSAIPSHIVVEVNLPMLSSTKDCILDVKEKSLSLTSEKPAKYKLNLTLPYSVNDECGNAKFDKSKRMLIVTLPVIKKSVNDYSNSLKVDSGVESEENSGSQSDEDCKESLIEELPSPLASPLLKTTNHSTEVNEDSFLDPSLGYMLPSYTYNVMDEIVAFTFHVKNTEPDSVKVKTDCNKIYIKFTSIGSGYVPIHYGGIIVFGKPINFDNVSGEAWDNNVILQLEVIGDVPQKFQIGLSEDSLTSKYFDMPQASKTLKPEVIIDNKQLEGTTPVIEVTNLGTETNIVVSSNNFEYGEDDAECMSMKEKEIVWTETENSVSGAKSILRKQTSMTRSFSESSMGDVASSMDYISSDCVPEESSLKKTVRFNDVIAKQFYRYNSSIEGQKKKNQRRKSKKRNQERHKSESEAEDDVANSNMTAKPRLKSVLKQRRDSGLADTSDAEDCKSTPLASPTSPSTFTIPNDSKDDLNENVDEKEKIKSVLNIDYKAKAPSEPTIWESTSESAKTCKTQENLQSFNNITCDNIKHNTDLYNPDKLNKGQYLEVAFKNDLIFDLDM